MPVTSDAIGHGVAIEDWVFEEDMPMGVQAGTYSVTVSGYGASAAPGAAPGSHTRTTK